MTSDRLSRLAGFILAVVLAVLAGACGGHDGELTGSGGDRVGSSFTLLVSTPSTRSAAVPLAETNPSGSVYIFTSDSTKSTTPAGTQQVSYWLDNTAMSGTATHVEDFTPYDFAGSADDGTANPWAALWWWRVSVVAWDLGALSLEDLNRTA